MNTLKALKRCSLGIDLYLWLSYRIFSLRVPLQLSWRQVYRQFGVDPAKASDNQTVQDFRYKVLRELKKIKLAWPELHYTTARGVLILHPSTPAIPPVTRADAPRGNSSFLVLAARDGFGGPVWTSGPLHSPNR